MSLDNQEPLMRAYATNPDLSSAERKLRTYLADAFVLNSSKLLWCILAKSRGQPKYNRLVRELQEVLSGSVEKAPISENLALMVVELLGYTEVSHYRQVTERLLKGRMTGSH